MLESDSGNTTDQEQPVALTTPVLYTMENRVIQRFFTRWAAGQTCLGCLDSMPEIFESSGPDTAIKTAIVATAYADLAVFERHGDRGNEFYRAYFDTLRRLQNELASPTFTPNHSIFAAVLTVDAFELLYMGRTEPLGVHTQAIVRFLELLRDSTATSRQIYSLWRSAFQRVHVRQLSCDIPSLTSASLCNFATEEQNRPEVRTIRFVADACEVISLLKNERDRRSNLDEIARLCALLRAVMQDAHTESIENAATMRKRDIGFDVQSDIELSQTFTRSTVGVYETQRIARDRLLFHTCCIKILDSILEARSLLDNSQQRAQEDIQLDVAQLQAHCDNILEMMPYFVGLVDINGIMRIDPWTLNDTGVLSVKSPLRTIIRSAYPSSETRVEATSILEFLSAHKHVIWPS